MLSIRLMRTGKIHAPHYRIVVQEKRSKLNGKAVDTIGHYHPAQTDKLLVINKERADYWLSKGAQPSDTVTNLFVKDGIYKADKKVHNFFTPTKKEEAPKKEVKEEVKAEAPTEEVVEEVAEEVAEAPTEETEEIATEEPTVTEEAAPEADTAA